MKETGIIRRIDDLGRVAIPREIRHNAGISELDPFEICYDDNGVYLKKYTPGGRLLPHLEAIRSMLSEGTDNFSMGDLSAIQNTILAVKNHLDLANKKGE